MRKRDKHFYNNRNYLSYNTKNDFLVTAIVTEIMEYNKEYPDSIKNSFKCAGTSGGEKICIYWERCNLCIGDTVQMKGWYNKQGIFIVKSLLVIVSKRANATEV